MGKIVITHEKLEEPSCGSVACLPHYTSVQTLITFWINAMSACMDFE